jgi:transcription antitermination factor NusA-like protein
MPYWVIVSKVSVTGVTYMFQVTRGYAPVIGVKAMAVIEGDNTKIIVPLQDKGIGEILARIGFVGFMFSK